jgi:hypothetical protein
MWVPYSWQEMRFILIDDDKLIHLSWRLKAAKSSIDLQCFFAIDDFFSNLNSIPFDSKIFIDSNLGNGILGHEEAEKIYLAGYSEIYLTTGFTDFSLDKYPWLSSVITKHPPF